MRFLIDLQCAQSGSRNRGIGRYALSLLDEMIPAAEDSGHEIHLLLNSAFGGTIPEVQRRYLNLHEQQCIHIFHGLNNSSLNHENGNWRKSASEIICDFAIKAIEPDVVFCPSIFEGDSENFALSAPNLLDIPVVATQHDLIPIQMPDVYFEKNPQFESFYKSRLKSIKEYKALIAVSKATRDETLSILKYPTEQLYVVPEDADPKFKYDDTISLNKIEAIRTRYGLSRPYLLYVGSGEPRKNLIGLVRAYSRLTPDLRETHDLVVIGSLTKEEADGLRRLREELFINADNIRLLGKVSDVDLPMLYTLASIFIMPSFYEGFGLPALEAIRCGTLTLGANRTSLPEVIGTPEALFDPANIDEIATLITKSLKDQGFASRIKSAQTAHSAQFSWSKAAQDTLKILERYARENSASTEWSELQTRLNELEAQAIESLRNLPKPETGLRPQDQNDLARALSNTRLSCQAAWRPRPLPQTPLRWHLEGPFDSTYSLASVNRETATALDRRGVDIALVSAEGDGPFDPDPTFLKEHPKLAELHQRGMKRPPNQADVQSRNMFPPRVWDMEAPFNLLHGYAWEESGLPQDFTRDMAAHLQGILVTSPHVRKIFEDAGVGVPLAVVGNGVDHLDIPFEPLPDPLPQAEFTLLHVSSCFPRKGADILLNAFSEAFTADDKVHLIIKTFPNPHNDIADQVERLKNLNPASAPITVIEQEFTPGQMRSLYASADLLVAPSRAEGYCLPVAEAILAGTPALTTGWGGQRIFSGNPLVSFLEYSFMPAESHLGAWDSVWAEPDHMDLVKKLQAHRTGPKPNPETCHLAAQHLLSEHSWDKVAERSETAVRTIAQAKPKRPPKVGWVSSYNTRCGIATYSQHLIDVFPDEVTVFASHTTNQVTKDTQNIYRCWKQDCFDPLLELRSKIKKQNPDALIIQFNFGFYNLNSLSELINEAKEDNRSVTIMLHATDDSTLPREKHLSQIKSTLDRCDHLLVHSYHDMNRLKEIGLENNVTLFPHGVTFIDDLHISITETNAPLTLGTYGFFLPPKGFDKLISAVSILHDRGTTVNLHMINAEFPDITSRVAIDNAQKQILDLNLQDHIVLDTHFLTDIESFSKLQETDVIVFPYQNTAESASGAVRQALALNLPVVTTPLKIFEDVKSLTLTLPGTSPEDIANGLEPIIKSLKDITYNPALTKKIRNLHQTTTRWRQTHAYQVLAQRLWNIIKA